jgi:hypothetical protein
MVGHTLTVPPREPPARRRCTLANRAMARISIATVTGLAVSDRPDWLSRLHREWTKNDGKAREEWAPGRDLKEAVLIGLVVVLTIGQVVIFGLSVLG